MAYDPARRRAVGQASITVSLDDSPIEIKEVDVELNPDA